MEGAVGTSQLRAYHVNGPERLQTARCNSISSRPARVTSRNIRALALIALRIRYFREIDDILVDQRPSPNKVGTTEFQIISLPPLIKEPSRLQE